jgi:hypothetical protein
MTNKGNVIGCHCRFGITLRGCAILALNFALCASSSALAAPPTRRQEEVLRSINQSVGQPVDGTKVLASLLAILGVVVMIALLSQRQKRSVTPKTLNHPGKLLKEVSRTVNLKPAELKQLKVLTEDTDISSPLVLLLCPSVLARTIKENADRVDRGTLSALAKKLNER